VCAEITVGLTILLLTSCGRAFPSIAMVPLLWNLRARVVARACKVQDETWKELALPVPECGVTLFSDAGRALLEAAESQVSSACATVARVFSKQGTPTSCGVCCAVIAVNVLEGAGLASGPAGWRDKADWQRAVSADSMGGGGLQLERAVRERCSELVGADRDILHRHGLTLRQVAKLCSSLLAGDGDVTTFSCDKGHTIHDFRSVCRARLGSGKESTSIIIANMYMGDVSKNGLGSVSVCGRQRFCGYQCR
jgi:hypothetical protein